MRLSRTGATPKRRGEGLRILLVEDHADTARVIVSLLRRDRYKVFHAADDGSALRLAAAERELLHAQRNVRTRHEKVLPGLFTHVPAVGWGDTRRSAPPSLRSLRRSEIMAGTWDLLGGFDERDDSVLFTASV